MSSREEDLKSMTCRTFLKLRLAVIDILVVQILMNTTYA